METGGKNDSRKFDMSERQNLDSCENGSLRMPFSPNTVQYMTSNDSLHPFTHSTHSETKV